jgi:hypothetical protein
MQIASFSIHERDGQNDGALWQGGESACNDEKREC